MNKTIVNTYEATWYLIKGAKLVDVRVSKLKANKITKKEYAVQWQMKFEDIPEKAIKAWRLDRAQYPLKMFGLQRQRLKKRIKEFLDQV